MTASAATMRAVRFHEYGPSSTLVLDEVPRPEPAEGQVLVRVRVAAVNAIDWKFRAGYLQAFMPLELPHTPGLDVAGIVEQVGPGVSGYAAGDEVFGRGSGTYAEFAVAPAATLAHKPRGVTFEQAATLPVGGVTAWVGLFDIAHLEAGQRALVHGAAGGVGSLAVQLAHWKGAHVIATTSTANVAYVESLGADEVIDYSAVRFEDVVHDVDVVYDAVGGEVTGRSWSVLKKDGILVVVAGGVDPEAAAAHGVRTSIVRPPDVTTPILEELARLVESGALIAPVGKLVSTRQRGSRACRIRNGTWPRADRAPGFGALIALFLLPAGVVFHPFWTYGDPAARRTHESSFYRDVSLLGGALALFVLFAMAGHVPFALTGSAISLR